MADKESSLEDLGAEIQSLQRDLGEKEREYTVQIQQLDEEQKAEKEAQRELRKQVSHRKTPNSNLSVLMILFALLFLYINLHVLVSDGYCP